MFFWFSDVIVIALFLYSFNNHGFLIFCKIERDPEVINDILDLMNEITDVSKGYFCFLYKIMDEINVYTMRLVRLCWLLEPKPANRKHTMAELILKGAAQLGMLVMPLCFMCQYQDWWQESLNVSSKVCWMKHKNVFSWQWKVCWLQRKVHQAMGN